MLGIVRQVGKLLRIFLIVIQLFAVFTVTPLGITIALGANRVTQNAFATQLLVLVSCSTPTEGAKRQLIGLAFLVGILVMIDLRLLGFAKDTPLEPLKKYIPIAMTGFFFNLTTGLMLFVADAVRFSSNWMFLTKLGLITLGMVIGFTINRTVFAGGIQSDDIPPKAKTLALISIIVWMAAMTAGRMTAYLGD